MPRKGRAAWRDKGAVRLTGLFDMILGILLICIYLIAGLMMKGMMFQVPKSSKFPFSKVPVIIISLILWAMVFAITAAQVLSGYRLFIVTFQDALGPEMAVNRSFAWIRTSAVVFGLIIFKMVYCLLRVPTPSVVLLVICVIEILFRLLGIYYVREFCDDLKHHIKLITRSLPYSAKSVNDNEVAPDIFVVPNHVTV